MGGGLALPLLMLAIVGVGLAMVLMISGRRKRLDDRVGTGIQPNDSVTPIVIRSGSEAVARIAADGRGRVVSRLLRVPVDLPLAHVFSPAVILIGTSVVAVVVFVGSRYLLSSWASLGAAGFAWITLTRGVFGWELDRYRVALLQQLPDTIHLVISATRAGLPVTEAFRTVVNEMANPTAAEFARVVDEMALGVAADEALLNMHRRTGVTEFAIFAVTIGVQARSGGRLAETISNLAETVRDRIAIVGKAHALSAEARTSAGIMIVLPILTGAVLGVTRPGYLSPLFTDPRGQTMLIVGVVTLVLGTMTMRHLIRGATRD